MYMYKKDLALNNLPSKPDQTILKGKKRLISYSSQENLFFSNKILIVSFILKIIFNIHFLGESHELLYPPQQ